MQRLSHNQIGICQGSRVLFSDYVDDGPMWTGDGPREHRTAITFDTPYTLPPTVQVAMTMWDAHSNTNQRMDLSAENITKAGFDLVFRTWGDSRVARVRASWMVIGALPHEDDWQL